ncbi:MAG: DUF5916 domain-containing protein [Gemmatimonadales bacterium]
MTRWPMSAVLLAALVVPGSAGGQTAPAPPPRKQARALRLDRETVRLDGRLDEAAWRRAAWISDFVQKEPNEGAAPTERTEVAFFYDADALYVGVRAYADDPAKIQAPLSRRDNTAQAEHVWISLDTYLDHRTAYSFGVTASGVRMDFYHATDREHNVDGRFDPVWEARAAIDSLGWTAELRIPFSQLRYTAKDAQVWGLNIDRWIPSRREDVFWIPVPKNETGWASRMGELHGIERIAPSRRLELLPYAASNATLTGDRDPADPFDDGRNLEARAGADMKMGVGPNLTLDATVNPDFGQVEADPAIVNLSAFEVFFDERRPFFTEGSQLFPSRFFYTRRVGARPRGAPVADDDDYVDYPDASTILGAAKLTGRLRSGTSVGVLAALTARERARAYDPTTARVTETVVAPVSGFGALRTRQEIGADASVGGTLTMVRRDLADGDPLAGIYAREAYGGRLDWNLRFGRDAYVLDGDIGFSHVRGDSSVLLHIQESPVHYFQRPDAGHVAVDSSRTALSGYVASLAFSKISARHWLYEVSVGRESPGFEPNDAGRLSNADGQNAFAQLRYRETQPGQTFHTYELSFETGGEWNFGNDRQFYTTRWDAKLTWKNFWVTNLTFWIDHPSQNQAQTRGGPSMGTPRSRVVIARLGSRLGARTAWNGRGYYGWDELGGEIYRLSGGLSVRPSTRWQVSVDPNYLRVIDPRQYVATFDSGPAATYGRRYVFAFVDQSEFRIPIRANYTLTPDLTLELFAEPFAASGRFYGFGELAAPRTTRLRRYGTDGTTIARDPAGDYLVTDNGGADTLAIANPDFNVLSFRSNLVLRWEWRPGSTLFLVWQQNRQHDDARGAHVGPADLMDSLRATGDNFLAIKASYWIPVR